MPPILLCLIQWTEGKQEKPIAFASCKLTATQSAMSTIEREAFENENRLFGMAAMHAGFT